MCTMQIAVARATHATMSTERANDRLITVHAPFLAIAPNQNVRKQNIVWEFAKMFETMLAVQLWRAINAQCTTRVGTGACTVISR